MNVGWIQDWMSQGEGGAELTAKEFALAGATSGHHLLSCDPTYLDRLKLADIFVVQNCVTFDQSLIPLLEGKPVVRYYHDLSGNGDAALNDWLLQHSFPLFPSHAACARFNELFGVQAASMVIPPPMPVAELSARKPFGHTACWVGRIEYSKGVSAALNWATETDNELHFYGMGGAIDLVKGHPKAVYHGRIAYHGIPDTLEEHNLFVFLPVERETFSRTTYEAWIAGLALVINDKVPCREFMSPEGLIQISDAADNFWRIVEGLA